MANWVIKNKKADFSAISKQLGIREITARLLVNRGLVCEQEINEYLESQNSNFFKAGSVTGLEKTCEILESKIKTGKKIRVIGDYDVGAKRS